MDDILVIGNDLTSIGILLHDLAAMFPIKDMGYPHYFLGVELLHTESGLQLSQRKYILDLLVKAKMDGIKPVTTPMTTSHNLLRKHFDPFKDPTLFRQLVGSLQYLSITRPDIGFVIGKLSQMKHDLSNDHWLALKRVLRYLKGTIQFGLCFSKNSDSQLRVFTNVDWASCLDDRRSTTGYVIFFGSNHFPGLPRSNLRWLVLLLKLNFEQLLMELQRYLGFSHCALSWVCFYHLLRSFSVTMLVPFI